MNLGTNRWALKTEFGLTHPMGKWLLEAYAGAWWFDDNDNFFGGQLREQDPLASIQAHVSYTFKPQLWVALNTTYYEGGQTTVNGVEKDGPPVQLARRRHLLHAGRTKIFAQVQLSAAAPPRASAAVSRTYGVGLQYAWMEKPRP